LAENAAKLDALKADTYEALENMKETRRHCADVNMESLKAWFAELLSQMDLVDLGRRPQR
jgi:hypothetical protein